MKDKKFIISIVILVSLTILQSTLFPKLAFLRTVPDFACIFLIFLSYSVGNFRGQMLGFITGITMDFLSLSPFGFYAFSRTIIGYVFGSMKGKLFIDPVLVPFVFALFTTLFKTLSALFQTSLFLDSSFTYLFSSGFFIETGINSFLAPFVFLLLKSLSLINPLDREQEYGPRT